MSAQVQLLRMMASHVLDNERLQMKAEEDMVAAQAVHAAAVLARRDALAAIGEDALLRRKQLAAEEARNAAVEEDDRARKVAAKEDFNMGLLLGHALGSQRYGR